MDTLDKLEGLENAATKGEPLTLKDMSSLRELLDAHFFPIINDHKNEDGKWPVVLEAHSPEMSKYVVAALTALPDLIAVARAAEHIHLEIKVDGLSSDYTFKRLDAALAKLREP